MKMNRRSASPSPAMAFCGASLFVALFTDGICLPFSLSWKDRSRMARYFLDLCGIIAIGEIFRFGGMLFLISFHFIFFAKPSFIFVSVSFIKHCLASFPFAEMCAPRFSDAIMWSLVQLFPQLTGQPLSLYECSSGAASCMFAMPRGHISPNLPMSSSKGIVLGMMLLLFMIVNNCFEVVIGVLCILLIVCFCIGVSCLYDC